MAQLVTGGYQHINCGDEHNERARKGRHLVCWDAAGGILLALLQKHDKSGKSVSVRRGHFLFARCDLPELGWQTFCIQAVV